MAVSNLSKNEQEFLQKVKSRADLPDIYDAQNLTNIVFRTMRDMMSNEMDKQTEAAFAQADIAELWQDNNPFVSFLSKLCSPLKIDSELFLRRIKQEGGLPKGTTAQGVAIAVFSVIREELTPEKAQEISQILPEALRIMWEQI